MSRGASALRGVSLAFLGAVAVAAVSVAVVWPIWYLATAHTGAYTLVCLSATGAFLVWRLIDKRRRRGAESAGSPPSS